MCESIYILIGCVFLFNCTEQKVICKAHLSRGLITVCKGFIYNEPVSGDDGDGGSAGQ